jgi:hypothetical protein
MTDERQKMNPEVKARWVEALRSGRYEQIQKWLHTETGYCCLGVLCDLSGLGQWQGRTMGRDNFFAFVEHDKVYDAQSGDGFPTGGVDQWAGLDFGRYEVIAKMNDDGKSFSEIADWIETNL